MSIEADETINIERERQERFAELAAELGSEGLARFRPGTFGCHELLDRTALLAGEIERLLINHPACAQDPTWYALAREAATALNELYQRIGARHLDAD